MWPMLIVILYVCGPRGNNLIFFLSLFHRFIQFQIILSRGFQYQQHFVTTEDGYILQLIRIVNPFINDRRQRNDNLKPIVLFHGFQCTGSFWLITMAGRLMNDGNYYEFDAEEDGHRQHFNGTEAVDVGNTIGFVLASRGFDVWVVNYRGSIYSNNHVKFNTKSKVIDQSIFHFN